MSKKLCDLKPLLKKDQKTFSLNVVNATHMCTKCGRAANCKKKLCEAVKLKVLV